MLGVPSILSSVSSLLLSVCLWKVSPTPMASIATYILWIPQFLVSCLYLCTELHTHVFSYPLGISSWMGDRQLTLTMFKTQFLTETCSLCLLEFGTTIYLVTQTRDLEVVLDFFSFPFLYIQLVTNLCWFYLLIFLKSLPPFLSPFPLSSLRPHYLWPRILN